MEQGIGETLCSSFVSKRQSRLRFLKYQLFFIFLVCVCVFVSYSLCAPYGMIASKSQYHALQSAIIKINLHFIGVDGDRMEHVMEGLIEF